MKIKKHAVARCAASYNSDSAGGFKVKLLQLLQRRRRRRVPRADETERELNSAESINFCFVREQLRLPRYTYRRSIFHATRIRWTCEYIGAAWKELFAGNNVDMEMSKFHRGPLRCACYFAAVTIFRSISHLMNTIRYRCNTITC